ncbi:HdeD family acid-resistance protein [Streptomyces echinatus]|uniref:Uncharacterized membrane protein HdeD (DUF308 family) n=1 Tax=Streptomyces echinatus TaxID=67293 RepID=A0A7W9UPU6_9ACTN|nr:HdeD family acid-resistance protein [Streptomyces echinatus]MBB5926717.1 uncharacterized membrane protein HdeD (DUF308 family) [Streptomyces echinatus]
MTESRGHGPYTGAEQVPGGAPHTTTTEPPELLTKLGRSWTWILASAVTTLVVGVLVLVWPGETLHVLAVLIGLYLLVTGAFRFVAVFGRESHGERLPLLLSAVLYVLAGVLCLRNPLQTITALSVIVGIVWLASGILTLYTALAARGLPHRGFMAGTAVIGILAAVVVLALPSESARALTRLLGLWLVLVGLSEVGLAFSWRAGLRRSGLTGSNAPGTPR